MAGGPLRRLAYRHRWLYDSVTAVSSLSVGGTARLRRLAADWLLAALPPGARVLDLCCGSGEAAAPLLAAGAQVTGLDIAPRALELAARRHPSLTTVQGLAENPPLPPGSFDGIQISLALHEFPMDERRQVLRAARRLVTADGRLALVDLHPAGPALRLPQQLFCHLFETETATAFLALDLGDELQRCGWHPLRHELLAGGALQRWLAEPLPPP